MMNIVTAVVSKKANEVWAGEGKVISVDLGMGIASLTMLTGKMKGNIGGFNLEELQFKVVRLHVGGSYHVDDTAIIGECKLVGFDGDNAVVEKTTVTKFSVPISSLK